MEVKSYLIEVKEEIVEVVDTTISKEKLIKPKKKKTLLELIEEEENKIEE